MANKDECPLCRHQISDFHLRKNPTVEDAVRAWKVARCALAILPKRKDSVETAASKAVYSRRSEGAEIYNKRYFCTA
jgi:E3 ubiquitin-protein ligase RAD18